MVSAQVMHAAGETGAGDPIEAIFVLFKVTLIFVSLCLELDAIFFFLVQKKGEEMQAG